MKPNKRISENELTIPALELLKQAPDQTLTTSEMQQALDQRLKPQGEDSEILDGRHDSKFSQKVRNLISHRHQSTSPIRQGFMAYDKSNHSLTLTHLGDHILMNESPRPIQPNLPLS